MRKLYYAVEGGKYVSYISLFTDNPLRLADVEIVERATSQRMNNRHVIYTEKEAHRLLKINKKVAILEIFE